MTVLLAAAGRTFLKNFTAALIAYGVASAANLHVAGLPLLLFSVLLAAVAAGLTSLQVYVPQLTLSDYMPQPYGALADAFAHGFLGSILVTLPIALTTSDLTSLRGLMLSAFAGAANAGLRALEGAATQGELPLKLAGVKSPHTLTVDRQIHIVPLSISAFLRNKSVLEPVHAPGVLSSTIEVGVDPVVSANTAGAVTESWIDEPKPKRPKTRAATASKSAPKKKSSSTSASKKKAVKKTPPRKR